ncbi:hypothetical protein [uncultured Tateyamaria sp.]|uniref:hypothetical protein n=1 Tax=Tateyamaria sp. 1078 TaxID=3417464 RepID=UPI00262B232E|nr:hypothetical protein [uncultured Tateyamaria sp.]
MTNNNFSSPEATIAYYLKETSQSLRTLEANTGLNKSRLSDLKNQKGKGLLVTEAIILADALGVPRSSLVPLERSLTITSSQSEAAAKLGQAMSSAIKQNVDAFGDLLSTDAVEAWYFSTGGRLVDMPEITPHLLLFKTTNLDSKMPEVLQVGERCLAADRIGTDLARVEKYIGYLSEARPETIECYNRAASENTVQTHYRTVAFRNADVPYILVYKTVLMPVTDVTDRFIWNFSKCVSVRPATAAELADSSIPEGA